MSFEQVYGLCILVAAVSVGLTVLVMKARAALKERDELREQLRRAGQRTERNPR